MTKFRKSRSGKKSGHGGARVGAGRKRIDRNLPVIPFDLATRLQAIPRGPIAQYRRTVLALSSYGARDPEIAAALGMDCDVMRAFYAEEYAQGRALIKANLIRVLWAKAEAGSITAILWLARQSKLGRRRSGSHDEK